MAIQSGYWNGSSTTRGGEIEREFYLDKDIWKCPKCGNEAHQYVCGNCGFKIYVEVVERFLAHLIDLVFTSMLLIILDKLKGNSPLSHLIVYGFEFLVLYVLNVFLVGVWGQTLGKMLFRIKILRADGSKVLWSNAWRRVSVGIGFIALYYFFISIKIFSMFTGTNLQLGNVLDVASLICVFAFLIYKFCDVYVLLKSEKHRAIHDLIGGTVVIHDPR